MYVDDGRGFEWRLQNLAEARLVPFRMDGSDESMAAAVLAAMANEATDIQELRQADRLVNFQRVEMDRGRLHEGKGIQFSRRP